LTKLKYLLIVTNEYIYDERVKRETSLLANMGIDVVVLAWARNELPRYPNGQDIKLMFFALRSEYGQLGSFILKLPAFWCWSFLQVLRIRPNVIHCNDFDTMIVGVLYKVVNRQVRLFYDAHEKYSETVRNIITNSIGLLLVGILEAIDNLVVQKMAEKLLSVERAVETLSQIIEAL
jgi:hypothetical protein